MRQIAREFSRYTLASGLALAVDAGLLLVITELGGQHYLVGATTGFVFGAVTAYLLSVKWVFSHRRVDDPRQEFLIFVIIGVSGLVLNNALMWSFTEFVGLHYLASKGFAAGCVFLFNFVLRRHLLFAPAKNVGVVAAQAAEVPSSAG